MFQVWFCVGTDNFLIEAVFAPDATTCQGQACTVWEFASGNADPIAALTLHGGTATCVSGASQSTAAYSAGAHIFGARRTSATALEVRIDGTATPSTVGSVDLNSVTRFSIGRVTSLPLAGSFAELQMVHNPSDTDVTNLESYLKAKYGL